MRFIEKEYGPNILRLFQSIDEGYGAARADLFRYLALYRLGGVYLDVKTRVDCSFDDWICESDTFILSQHSISHKKKYPGAGYHKAICNVEGGEFINWFLFSAPRHPYLKQVIEYVLCQLRYYSPFLSGVGKGATLATTGPVAFTLAISPVLGKYPYRFVNDLDAYGIYYSIRDGAGHEAWFPNHYRKQLQPLVKIHSWHWGLYKSARYVKGLLNRFLTVSR